VAGLAGLQLPTAATAVSTAGRAGTAVAPATTSERVVPPADKADLDVLYVGAHPDDEAFRLSTFGEWKERYGARTGVVTITRGEGGGNAVGPEEGPALGLLREHEERSAVGTVGIRTVYNLDKVDFYYSVSAPLHQQAWGQRDTLRRLVRIIRETRPQIIITMNPAPSPGNHGGHQNAGLLATQAYYAAGNPSRFPGQLRSGGLEPFAPAKLLLNQALGTAGATGPNCPIAFTPQRPTDDVYGVWEGRRAADGTTWAQLEREAQRRYASQGWAVFPDVPADPQALGCDFYTQVDARVPFTRGDLTADAGSSATMLEGAVLQAHDGLPLGTRLDVSTDQFQVVAGGTSTLRVSLSAPNDGALRGVTLHPELPSGWAGPSSLTVGRVARGDTVTRTFTITAPDPAAPERVLVGLTLRSQGRAGITDQQLQVVPAVEGTQQLLPQVAEFNSWSDRVGVPQLKGIVKPVLTLPSGGTRTVAVEVANHDDEAHSGEVTLELPDGFSTDGPVAYDALAAGASTRLEFTVTNTDGSLPTSNDGGVAGDYDYTIRTTSDGGESTSAAALELVPTATLPEAAAPTLDGQITDGEYAAEIDLSRVWEGSACDDAADCSATGWITRSGDALYVAADVTDDVLGTVLEPTDCKRHWRVDSLEIAIDPTGTSENTSTTFKAAVLPTTTDGVACAARDADNRQGPIGTFRQVGGTGTPKRAAEDTAPGFDAVSRLKDPFTGYVIEVKIPFSALPATVDPDRMGFNAFIYDSDSQDKTGQTRLGWSTFGGVQGDPYRWGRVVLEGAAPPQVPTSAPLLDFPALQSVESPPSIAQAVRTGVPLSGLREARRGATLVRAVPRGGAVRAVVDVEGPGTAHLFAVSRGDVRGAVVTDLGPGRVGVRIPTEGRARRVLLGYDAEGPGTESSAVQVRRRCRCS